jgi:hypothetical protein
VIARSSRMSAASHRTRWVWCQRMCGWSGHDGGRP